MKKLLKNYLLKSKHIYIKNHYKHFLMLVMVAFSLSARSQIANYVSNGGFEERYNCTGPFYLLSKAKNWLSIDSLSYGGTYISTCNSHVPLNGNTYQYPHSGNSYIISTFFCLNASCGRGYFKNRLKSTLKSGSTYCVRFYINISNSSPRGMDGFGAYFGGNLIDTISYCTIPLDYINPQVKNPLGNVISDTLNWVAITGTFVANGTEKYLVLGNFLADNAVATASINTPYFPQYWTDVCVDDVSCIDVDLPADAGSDKALIPGDSVFIGRQPDVGIDEACFWYKLPTAITPTTPAIDTVAGLWVKPVTTTTYVVRQQLWCSGVKYDTVVIYMNPVGLEKLKILSEELKIYPIPAKEHFELRISNNEWMKEFNTLLIYNNLGLLLREEELRFKDGLVKIEIGDLPNGAYSIQLKSSSNEIINKRFMIAR